MKRQLGGGKGRVQNGRTVLLLIGLVTVVDTILKAVYPKLTFPCKVDFPLWLVDKGQAGSLPTAVGYVACVLFAALYLLFFFWTRKRDAGQSASGVSRSYVFRVAWILYLADTLFYSIRSAAEVNASGFKIAHIIEIVFHVACTVLLFLADRAAARPETEQEELLPPEEPDETNPPENDPEDDEGIQW